MSSPTLSQIRHRWHCDLQVNGLQALTEAARSSRPSMYIAHILDVIRDSYQPREATYLCMFILHHAEARGLLGE